MVEGLRGQLQAQQDEVRSLRERLQAQQTETQRVEAQLAGILASAASSWQPPPPPPPQEPQVASPAAGQPSATPNSSSAGQAASPEPVVPGSAGSLLPEASASGSSLPLEGSVSSLWLESSSSWVSSAGRTPARQQIAELQGAISSGWPWRLPASPASSPASAEVRASCVRWAAAVRIYLHPFVQTCLQSSRSPSQQLHQASCRRLRRSLGSSWQQQRAQPPLRWSRSMRAAAAAAAATAHLAEGAEPLPLARLRTGGAQMPATCCQPRPSPAATWSTCRQRTRQCSRMWARPLPSGALRAR